jgi:hypothetical protein
LVKRNVVGEWVGTVDIHDGKFGVRTGKRCTGVDARSDNCGIHVWANGIDDASRIKAKGYRHRTVAIRTRADIRVNGIDAGSHHLYTNLIVSRLRGRNVHNIQNIRISKLSNLHGTHR